MTFTEPALAGPVVAIDGPSGAGKSTVARLVARRLGWGYLDTGAMYRIGTVWCRRSGVDLSGHDEAAAAIAEMPLRITTDPDDVRVFLGSDEVTGEIRSAEVSAVVSQVSTNLAARKVLGQWQRTLAAAGHMVVEGRDITTVITPDAPVRVLLTASPDARLVRRARELYGDSSPEAIAATRDVVLRRDQDDSSVVEFMTPAEGVTLIDTSGMSIEEAVEAVLARVHAVMGDG